MGAGFKRAAHVVMSKGYASPQQGNVVQKYSGASLTLLRQRGHWGSADPKLKREYRTAAQLWSMIRSKLKCSL